MTSLHVRGITKSFAGMKALDDVDLNLAGGEVHALIGENGAGKSSLMKVLSGAYRADQGTMTLDGRPYAPRGPRDARDAGVAMIYQELAITPHLSVEANVMLGREVARLGFLRKATHRKIVREALDVLDHPDIRPEAIAGDLSPGARQLVEVARALANDARVIVFDEPTSSLTEKDVARLFGAIARLRENGIAVVYISHFLEELGRIADAFTVMRDGRTVRAGRMAEVSLREIVAWMVGRDLSEMFPKVPHEVGEPVLTLEKVGGSALPRDVNLTLRRGEILGIAGLVGAGRTELLRAVFGLDPVRTGLVRVREVTTQAGSPGERISQGLGLVSEDRKGEGLALGQTIEENLTGSRLERYARWGWLDLKGRRRATKRWMEAMRVKARGPSQEVGSLSGGNQQKVAIARLLHQEADILLLDEPTRGIDVGSKAEIYRTIGELAAEGRSILMVSSYLPELLGVCDRIAVMSRGRLSPARPTSEWSEHAIMDVATGA